MNRAGSGVSSSAVLRRAPMWRLLVVTLAVVVSFVGSTIYSHRVAAHLDEVAVSIAVNAAPSVDFLSAARGELAGIERKAAQAVEMAGAGAPIDRAPIEEAFSRTHQDLTHYLSLPFYETERAYWAAVEQSTRLFEQRVSAELDELSAGRVQEAAALLSNSVRPSAEATDEALQRLIKFDVDQQRRLSLEIPRLRSRSVLVAYLLDGLSAALTILLMALVLKLFATHVAVAANSTQLYQQLREERSTLQRLADASAQIGSLDYSETLEGTARALVPTFADLCVLHIVGPDGSFGQPVVATAGTTWVLAADPIPGHQPQPAKTHYVMRVRQNRKSEVISATPELLEQLADNAEHQRLLRQIPAKSLLAVPLIARDQLVGVCSFFSVHESRYSATEVALAEEIARRAALSIDNARLYRKAEVAIRAREEILAVVSHDLRNPLSNILMNAQFLGADAGEDARGAQVRQQAVRIRHSSDLMMRMIADLLDTAKIESGTLRTEPQVEHVESLVDEVLELFQPAAVQKSIRLGSNVAQPVPDVWCDRGRVLQVLSNLIGNALRFTPTGGTITIAVEPHEDQVKFTVADSGPGIRAEDLPHIFDRYWQPRSSRRGTAGLGLYIAKGIVEAHHGRIWADSTPGHGAVLTFTLPASSPAREPEDLPATLQAQGKTPLQPEQQLKAV